MPHSVLFRSIVIACLGWSAAALAVSPPSETLLPNTTKGWLSIPNVDLLRDHFKLTQLGKLVEDPVMQPFMEDLGKQLDGKISEAGVKLSISLADLDGVYGGEVALGMLKPDAKDKNSHALAMVVDITGKQEPATALLAKIDKNLVAKGARRADKKLGTHNLIIYTLPKKAEDKVPGIAAYSIEGDTLVASDNETILVGILSRLNTKSVDSLSHVMAYEKIAEKIHGEKVPLESHLRWFVEPLGYAEAVRAANGGKVKRGLDKLAVLRQQGFGCVQGIGGRIDLHTGEHEILHNSYAYAPAVAGAKKGEKYLKGANLLDFPNSADLTVQDWVPDSVSTYFTFNLEIQKAFKHFGSVFDAFADNPGTWEEVLDGLRLDPAGPEVDVNGEIVGRLANRITMVTDYKLPITPKSERVVVSIEIKAGADNEKKVLVAIRKLMKVEADARAIKIEGFEGWEIGERQEEAELPIIEIEGGFVAFEGGTTEPGEEVAVAAVAVEERPINWAITVAKGHLFIGTHVDFIADMIKDKAPAAQLKNSADLAKVRKSLEKLGSGEDSFRIFSRTDEAYRPTYELLRRGEMPQSETILGRVLNNAFAPDRKGAVREAEIDGAKMPEWEKVAGYFGPSGAFVQSEVEGWLVKGCLLEKALAEGEPKPPEEVAGGK